MESILDLDQLAESNWYAVPTKQPARNEKGQSAPLVLPERYVVDQLPHRSEQLDGLSTYHLTREHGMRGVLTDWFLWNGAESVHMGVQ